MATRLSQGLIQITDVNVFEVNEALRTLQFQIDKLAGLSGGSGLPSAAFGTGPVDVATTSSDGTPSLVSPSDHRHAHGSGYLPDAHHAKSHVHLADGSGTVAHTSLSTVGVDDHHNKSHVHSGDGSGTIAHSALSGLSADDHTQYALLAGRSGGQVLIGDTASTGDLSLKATSHADGGTVIINGVTMSSSESDFPIIYSNPILTGSANVIRGIQTTPTWQPSANVATGIGFSFSIKADPAAGKTITSVIGGAGAYATGSNGGALTNGYGFYVSTPVLGTVKPTNSTGIFIENPGSASITTAVTLGLQKPTGSTNNYYMSLDTADATDPTGGGGAATGRIPIIVAGILRYLAYY